MADFRSVDWRREQDRGCSRKQHLGREVARRVAESWRSRGEAVRAYRCPWCDRGWCVGHVLSVRSMERLAAALRARANDPEGPDAA